MVLTDLVDKVKKQSLLGVGNFDKGIISGSVTKDNLEKMIVEAGRLLEEIK